MITPENIAAHELIGLKTDIAESSNAQILGLNGIIVDETKSMFTIKTNKGTKTISKLHNKWKFHLKDQVITLSGSLLEKRSHDRLEIKI